MSKELFSRNFKGDIIYWSINIISDTSAEIQHGLFVGKRQVTIIHHSKIMDHVASRIAKKLKEGYKEIKLSVGNDFSLTNLELLIPTIKYDANWNTKPMKCKPFKEKKLAYPVLGQAKLNGLRCVLRWEVVIEGAGSLFEQKISRAVLRTKEGLEYVMPHITNGLTEQHFIHNDMLLSFDGELYCKGKRLNQIKASCPIRNSIGTVSKPSGNPLDISFYTFDLPIENVVQLERINILNNLNSFNLKSNGLSIYSNYIHLIESVYINNDSEAVVFRNNCIAAGYEGCVLRSLYEEYAFGHRPSFIMKFKDHMDAEFLIIDIIPQEADPTKGMFVLKNDENDETFESMPCGKDFGSHNAQKDLLSNREHYIGKYATVRYRERSGIKNVPFHQNTIGIRANISSDEPI